MKQLFAKAPKYFLFGLNALALLFGLIFILSPPASWAGEGFGYLFVALCMVNAFVASADERRGMLAVAYLLSAAVAAGFLPFLLLLRGSVDEPGFFLPLLSYAFALGPLLLGAVRAFPLRSASTAGTRPPVSGRRPLFLALWIGIGVFLALLAFLAATSLTAPEGGMAGVMMPQLFPYFSLSLFALGGLSARIARRSGYFRSYLPQNALFMAANLLALFGLAGLTEIPGDIARAEASFSERFGVAASSIGTSSVPGGEGIALRASPFSLGEMFLGTAPPQAVSRLDQVYLKEKAANGKDYEFKFDQWSPVEHYSGEVQTISPGTIAIKLLRPVLIRIHGGAWVSGDKGAGNMGGMNRYFASLGFAVFDLQYGLNADAEFSLRAPTPPPLLGPFGLDDMVRQIGSFTGYLADHAAELGVDLDRVFVSGGSAGGHLVLASVLATASGYRDAHPGIGFDPRLKVRGLIPLYPAVGYASVLGVPGDPVLDNPERMLGSGNPPMLVFQGGLDGLVPSEGTRLFVEAYNFWGNENAALIDFPSAGHGADLIFWNRYNQVFLYYMERFMVLEAGA